MHGSTQAPGMPALPACLPDHGRDTAPPSCQASKLKPCPLACDLAHSPAARSGERRVVGGGHHRKPVAGRVARAQWGRRGSARCPGQGRAMQEGPELDAAGRTASRTRAYATRLPLPTWAAAAPATRCQQTRRCGHCIHQIEHRREQTVVVAQPCLEGAGRGVSRSQVALQSTALRMRTPISAVSNRRTQAAALLLADAHMHGWPPCELAGHSRWHCRSHRCTHPPRRW